MSRPTMSTRVFLLAFVAALSSATFFLGPQGALTESSSPSQRRRVLYNYAHHIAHAWIPKRCAGPGYFPFEWEFAPADPIPHAEAAWSCSRQHEAPGLK